MNFNALVFSIFSVDVDINKYVAFLLTNKFLTMVDSILQGHSETIFFKSTMWKQNIYLHVTFRGQLQ